MRHISFPNEEIKDLKDRISNIGFIYTTRVSKEFGKYRMSEVLKCDQLNCNLKVIGIRTIKGIEEHPFISELTDEQIKELSLYKKMELIKLKRAN